MSQAGGSHDQAMANYIHNRPITEALSMRKRLSALEALEDLRHIGRAPALPMEFTSQYGEDCWLWELFRGQRDGFYIEVGAFDGHTFSVTYPFESFGWKGLLVEPIPERYELARVRRPGSRVVNAALAGPGSTGTCTFTVVDGPRTGMLSYLTPTAVNIKDVAEAGTPTRKVTVPMTSMDAVLEGHSGPIDFAVIDVEGGEIPLIEGFDLKKYRPRVLLVEEGLPSMSSAVSKYMSKHPYVAAAYPWINRAYIHKDETDLIKRAQNLPIW